MAQKKMYPGVVNSPPTELAADITAAQTTIAVLSVAGLLAADGIATIGSGDNAETIAYASVSGTTLQGCVRGFQGPARAWGIGARVAREFTAYDHDTARQNIEDLQQQINEIEIPAATDEVAGIVRTNSSTTSDATDEAATPFAVKKVMDRADAAFTSASEGKGRVRDAITGAKGTVQVANPDVGPTFDELAAGAGTILAGATADATATAAQIRAGQTAYKGGQKVAGLLPVRATGAQTITANQTLAAGIYDGAITINVLSIPNPTPGTGYIALSAANRKSTSGVTTEELIFRINVVVPGRYRIRFTLAPTIQGGTATCLLKLNGVTIPSTTTSTSSAPGGIAYSYDFASLLNANDKIEVYGYVSGQYTTNNNANINGLTIGLEPNIEYVKIV